MRIPSPCRLRDRRLTAKPRITRTDTGRSFNVERMVPSSHPSIRGTAQTKTVDTLEAAIAVAHAWVGPKPQETP